MLKPTIHLGGTHRDTLADGYAEATHALRRAIVILNESRPNLRDFYPQGPDAINQATREHVARVAALEGVLAELSLLLEHASDSE